MPQPEGQHPAVRARALTTRDEWIQTRAVSDWNGRPAPELGKLPTLFLFLAAR